MLACRQGITALIVFAGVEQNIVVSSNCNLDGVRLLPQPYDGGLELLEKA